MLFSNSIRPYQICSNCVMDTTDSRITFDSDGVCDHCANFYENIQPHWHTDERGRAELEAIVKQIKKSGQGKDYDCILGLSGGMDSSYMLHMAVKELGLRPLVFHVDGGWDTEIGVHNVEVMVEKLGLDLFTEVIDWEEMRDLQLAFFRAGVPHIDIPQDHAFIAVLDNYASKHNIKHILNGGNFSTECVRNPMEWGYYGTDIPQIRDIHRRFGTIPLKNYPFSSILRRKLYLRYIKGIRVVKPLNYVPYTKKDAVKLLSETYGWKDYGRKHFESIFTKFFEGYWLPVRFGYDTRKLQYSSLILTGQMTREEALERLKEPSYNPETIANEFKYIATKLNITEEELSSYMDAPKKTYKDYKNRESMFILGARILQALGVERLIKR